MLRCQNLTVDDLKINNLFNVESHLTKQINKFTKFSRDLTKFILYNFNINNNNSKTK